MRKLIYLASTLLILAMTVLPIQAQDDCSGVVEKTVEVGEPSLICWDRNNPNDLVEKYVVVTTSKGGTVLFEYLDSSCGETACLPDIPVAFSTVGDYNVFCYAVDQDGQESDLSNALLFHVVNTLPPQPPSGGCIRNPQ